MVLVDAWQPIPPHVVEGVLDTIRNRLLEFVLRLEKVDPDILDSPGAGSRIPEERVTQLFNITINGDQNVLASGENIHQVVRQHTSSAGESDLMDQLQKLGVDQEDLENLRTALAEDGERTKKELGPRVRAWLGRMTEKAVTGAWKVTVETAPQIVVKALSQYYGWS